MKFHFIAIGGAAMHNLAIALHQKGYQVTGSDDEIFEPSRGRLKGLGLLPDREGWRPELITSDLDGIILGMHAREDNPELLRAREMGLKIFSYPEFLFNQSIHKKRIVIGGSHGKTTITAMILHVMHQLGIDTDFMVGAQLRGFDVMVRLTENAPYMVFEGDEYLTSPIDRRPKFHLYRPHIALLSGIAWDHMNVFPTFDNYKEQFREFIRLIEPGGALIWCADDPVVEEVVSQTERSDLQLVPYRVPVYSAGEEGAVVHYGNKEQALKIFGRHNLQNLEGARLVLEQIGVDGDSFLKAMAGFEGAARRLEKIAGNDSVTIYKDFAHSPSKLRATTDAVKEQFPERKLIACMELHTYSSLNSAFLEQYEGCMKSADVPVVYFNPHALQLKRLPMLTGEQIKKAFNDERLVIFNDSNKLKEFLLSDPRPNCNYLLMSSGNFDNLDLSVLSEQLTAE